MTKRNNDFDELSKLLKEIEVSYDFNNVDDVFNFGKYDGKTIRYVISKNPSYIKWCWENIYQFQLSTELADLFCKQSGMRLASDSKKQKEVELSPSKIEQLNNEIIELEVESMKELESLNPMNHPKWDDDLDSDQQDPDVWDRF